MRQSNPLRWADATNNPTIGADTMSNVTHWLLKLSPARLRQVKRAIKVLQTCGYDTDAALSMLYESSPERYREMNPRPRALASR